MAKQSLPSVDMKPLDPPAISDEMKEVHQRVGEAIAAEVMGYVSRRVDVKLSRAAAIKLRDKTRQLQDSGAKTADGRFVTNKTQAIQWIFENEVIV